MFLLGLIQINNLTHAGNRRSQVRVNESHLAKIQITLSSEVPLSF